MTLSAIPRADLAAAALVAAIGGFAAYEALSYPIGELRQMGPGFFPLALGILMVGLAVAIAFEGALAGTAPEGETERPNYRAVIAILAALGAFAYLVERLGLVPAIFAAVLVASLAERRPRPVQAVLLAAALAVACTALFVYGLALPLRAFRW
jgi:hypothetical protein